MLRLLYSPRSRNCSKLDIVVGYCCLSLFFLCTQEKNLCRFFISRSLHFLAPFFRKLLLHGLRRGTHAACCYLQWSEKRRNRIVCNSISALTQRTDRSINGFLGIGDVNILIIFARPTCGLEIKGSSKKQKAILVKFFSFLHARHFTSSCPCFCSDCTSSLIFFLLRDANFLCDSFLVSELQSNTQRIPKYLTRAIRT